MPVMTTCYVLETWIEEDRDWHRIDSRATSFEDLSQACDRAQKQANVDQERWRVVRVDECPVVEVFPAKEVEPCSCSPATSESQSTSAPTS